MQLSEAIRSAVGQRRQEDVAAATGVSQSKVSRWLNGDGVPSIDEVLRLEAACNRPRGFIFTAAGIVDGTSVAEAIELDASIDDAHRPILLGAYRAAVQTTAQNRGRNT